MKYGLALLFCKYCRFNQDDKNYKWPGMANSINLLFTEIFCLDDILLKKEAVAQK